MLGACSSPRLLLCWLRKCRGVGRGGALQCTAVWCGQVWCSLVQCVVVCDAECGAPLVQCGEVCSSELLHITLSATEWPWTALQPIDAEERLKIAACRSVAVQFRVSHGPHWKFHYEMIKNGCCTAKMGCIAQCARIGIGCAKVDCIAQCTKILHCPRQGCVAPEAMMQCKCTARLGSVAQWGGKEQMKKWQQGHSLYT